MWAQNWPEPIRAGPQVARARSVVAGWTSWVWQTGRPFDCSRPWRLTLTVNPCSWGGMPPSAAARWPLMKTAIGAGFSRGSL